MKVKFADVYEYIQYALMKEVKTVKSNRALRQFYKPTGGNKGAGFYSGTGGAKAVAAVLLAINTAASKQFTVRIDQNPKASPQGNEIVLAGVGQKIDDIKVPMSIISKNGKGFCRLEVKFGETGSHEVGIAVTKTGGEIPHDDFDVIVFVKGAKSLTGAVEFCIGLGSEKNNPKTASKTGQAFVKKVFKKTINTSLFAGNNKKTNLNNLAGLSTVTGTTQRKAKFTFDGLNAMTHTAHIASAKTDVTGKNIIISEGLMAATAYSNYCRQEPINLENARRLAIELKTTQQEIIDTQCKFDENGSSCFASLQHSNGRYLPIIPTWWKAGGKHAYFLPELKKSWKNFKKNTQYCVYYDFTGPSGSVALTGQTKKIKKGGPVNKAFGAQFPSFNIATFKSLVSKATAKQVQNALDTIITNINPAGKITTKAVDAFLKVKGIELNDIIALIQAGIGAGDILKAAVLSIVTKLKAAGKNVLTKGTKAQLIKSIKKIKLSGTKKIKLANTPAAIKALGVTKALEQINKVRKKKKWSLITSIYQLKKVAGRANKFTASDVSGALKKGAGKLSLNESIELNRSTLKKLLKEYIRLDDSLLSDFDPQAFNVNADDDDSPVVDLNGVFESSISLEGINSLVTILNKFGIEESLFTNSLNQVLQGTDEIDDPAYDDITFTDFIEVEQPMTQPYVNEPEINKHSEPVVGDMQNNMNLFSDESLASNTMKSVNFDTNQRMDETIVIDKDKIKELVKLLLNN